MKNSISFENNFLETAIKQFEYYKMLGNKSFEQLTKKEMFWQYEKNDNNIAILVKHIVGNNLSSM